MTPTAITSPAVLRWRARFAADPVAALDALLTGRVSLSPFDRASPTDALAQLLKPEEIDTADQAMQAWLEARMGKPMPEDLIPEVHAESLMEAFRAVRRLPLPKTRFWSAARHGELRVWLHGVTLDSSRDPESALLYALAYDQPDRKLLNLWLAIARRGRPLEHVRAALLGLRKMPADNKKTPEHGLPKALLRGLLDYGVALAHQGDTKRKEWLDEVDFLAVAYPMSKEAWAGRFREVLQAREVPKTVCNWLDRRYSGASDKEKGKGNKGFLIPPHVRDLEPLLHRLSSDFTGTRSQLTAFLERHRHYAQESGDSFYLVQTFCNVGKHLLKFDPAWARDLAHEAARWAPNDHHTWSLLARALEAEGDWRRAEAVYWHARRRFPHNAQSHSQLAHALVLHNQTDLGELAYNEAMRLFPDNPVCSVDHAHTLRVTGRLDEAVAAYRKAQERFHRDPVLARALADTLIDLKCLNEADDALVWAERIIQSNDEKNQQKFDQIRQRLRRAQAGEPIKLKTLHTPREGPGGDLHALADITGADLSDAPLLGCIGLWRHQVNDSLEKARTVLETLPEGSIKLIETGLWHATAQGWQAAAAHFDAGWESYAGDGVLRVHRQRAHTRAGETVDWSWERTQYPELVPVILTEEKGAPPHLGFDVNDQDLSEEQRQDLWFNGLVERHEPTLLDLAEESFLASRHLI